MNQPVNAEKVYPVNDRNQQRQGNEPSPIVCPAHPTKGVITVGKAPQHDILNCRPDRNADEEAPQEIVEVLALEPENVRRVFRRELGIVLEAGLLLALNVVEELDSAIEKKMPAALTAKR